MIEEAITTKQLNRKDLFLDKEFQKKEAQFFLYTDKIFNRKVSELEYFYDLSKIENNTYSYINILDSRKSISPSLLYLQEPINKSKYILELEDNWDDAGGEKYSIEVWTHAINFLINFASKLHTKYGILVKSPKIFHGPLGSIDFVWKKDSVKLLFNMPADKTSRITFYGKTSFNQQIEGDFMYDKYDINLIPFIEKE